MPTVLEPRHFETGRLLPSSTDAFFKWLSMDVEDNNCTGDVESPGGYVCLIYLETDYELQEYLDDMHKSFAPAFDEYKQLRPLINPGWYVTLQDDHGLIWTFEFGDGTLAEENARREFAGSEKYYLTWAAE